VLQQFRQMSRVPCLPKMSSVYEHRSNLQTADPEKLRRLTWQVNGGRGDSRTSLLPEYTIFIKYAQPPLHHRRSRSTYCKGPTAHCASLPLYPTDFTIRVVGSTSYQNVQPFIQGRQSTKVYRTRPDSSVWGGQLPSRRQVC
jgi:hypothetical protein